MKSDPDSASYKMFLRAAQGALEEETVRLLERGLGRVSSLECRWHPNGFAVFHLNDQHPLGNLRLHIWPDTTRIMRPHAAPIHTHAWHLCSRILSGTYVETLYEEVNAVTVDAQRYHSASINYLVNKNSITNPSTSLLRPIGTTQATNGEYHEVEAGIPHQTHILNSDFVATLLITSRPVLDKVRMHSPEEIRPSSYHRPELPQGHKTVLLHQLEEKMLKVLAGQDA